jgi:hypothetical protein
MLRLDVESEGLTLLKQWTDPKLYERAAKAGLRNASRGVKTLAGKEISARYNLKSSRVKDDIRGPRFIAGDFAVEFSFARKAPTLSGGYGFADRGKGLTGRVFRGGARSRVARGFQIASERGSAFALGWRRVNRKGRLPIEVVHGPSVGSIALGEGRFADDLQQAMGDRAMEQYVKGAQNYLARYTSS